MPTAIPDKGRVLTGLSKFWFDRTAELVPNHLISIDRSDFPAEAAGEPDLAGRSMLVRRLRMLPIECVVRGYLAGSSWKDYQATGADLRAPAAARAAPVGAAAAADLHARHQGRERPRHQHRRRCRPQPGGRRRAVRPGSSGCRIDIYQHAAAYALERGLIIADTKFEFGARRRRRAGAGRRGADARLLPLLAGRRLRARPRRRPRSTSSSCATGWRAWTGTSRRPGRSCPARSSRAPARATSRPTSG